MKSSIFVTVFYCYLQEEVVDGSLEFLILASDGLWDVVTNDVRALFTEDSPPYAAIVL
jgi:serine/threonine protein phosphatase PrpC